MSHARRLAQGIGLTVLALVASVTPATAATLTDLAVPSPVPVGQQFDLKATFSPTSSGMAVFRIYEQNGPQTCSGTPVEIKKSVTSDTAITAPGVSVPSVGSYWVSFEFAPQVGSDIAENCVTDGKPLEVAQRRPGIDLSLPSTATPGTAFTVKVALTDAFQPTGGIELWAYELADTKCTSPTKVVSGLSVADAASGAPLTLPAAGVYRIVAKYGGDDRNKSFATPCDDAKLVKVEAPAGPPTGGTVAPAPSPLTIGTTIAVTTRGKPVLRLPRRGSFLAKFQVSNAGSTPADGTFKLTLGGLKLRGALPKGKGLALEKDGSLTWKGTVPANASALIPALRLSTGKVRKATLAMTPVAGTQVAASAPALQLARETRTVKLDPPNPLVLKRGGSTLVTLHAVADVAVCAGDYRVQYAGTVNGRTRKPFTDQKRPRVALNGAVCELTWSSTFVPAVFSLRRLTFAVQGPKGDGISNRVVLKIKR